MMTALSSPIGAGFDDCRILQPGDFKRVKSQHILQARRASHIDYDLDAGTSSLTAPTSDRISPTHNVSSLPADFDLVIQSCPRALAHREARDRATFGPSDDDLDVSEEATSDLALKNLTMDSVSVADVSSDPEPVLHAHHGLAEASSLGDTPEASLTDGDAQLSQLKQEAKEAWACYRPGKTAQQCNLSTVGDRRAAASTSSQPAQIPQRFASLGRSSFQLKAVTRRDTEQSSGSVAAASSLDLVISAHDTGARSSQSTTPLSRTLVASSRGPHTSDMHSHRPYTASILSSASEGSLLSYQQSFDSGMRPLLLGRSVTSNQLSGRPQRPMTAGSIPTAAIASSDLRFSRPLPPLLSNRPETSNRLSAEERRQQVRRTKKLTQMLGEEMLLASDATKHDSNPARQSLSLGPSADQRRKKYRPQSMSFSGDAHGTVASVSPVGVTTGSRTRALSRKLLQSRSHVAKIWDHDPSELEQPPASAPVQGLNRKAAAILGIAHPYSSGALARHTLEDGEELNIMEEIHHSAHPFIHASLEEFNEPTPKVAQLAAFSAAALDEGASPTLPQDGPFRSFDPSHLHQALAMSESRKLAATRDERRRRVAKMSRWLGEAVPADLISSDARQGQKAVIRSTGLPASSHPSSMSHDSAGYAASEVGSANHTTSSVAADTASHDERFVSRDGSIASGMQSFMSIDSSDEESDNEAAPAANDEPKARRALTQRRSVIPLPVASDNISPYRSSIDSYEYLLENDHKRLNELASILHNARTSDDHVPQPPAAPITRPPRSPARPRTSPATSGARADNSRLSQPLSANDSHANRRLTTSESVDGVNRRSAAFLELSDSESDSSEADELHDGDDFSFYSSSLRSRPASSHDRSISKLSNFFGSTPSQIVRSQSDFRPTVPSAGSISIASSAHKAQHSRVSQPDALKTILKSLEEEAMDDAKLTSLQKSEISRKVNLLKKRTTKIFA